MSKKEVSINSRKKILKFENALINIADGVNVEGDGKQVVTDSKIATIKHTFADEIYVRQMSMGAGTLVVGAIHKHLHVWFLLTGNIYVVTEDADEEYIAPCYVVASPGTKRVIYAKEDSIFVNVHKNPTNTQDIEQLEKNIVAKNFKEYEEYINQKK